MLSEVRRFLSDLDPYGGNDPLGMFPWCYDETLRLSVVFRRLVHLGSFLACWRQANVTPIPKGPPSSSVANYQPISMTSVLSKVCECLVTVRRALLILWNTVVWFQPPNSLIGNVWATLMHFCAFPIHVKEHWRVGRRLGSCRLISVQPCDRVNHQGILHKLCSLGIEVYVWSILT